MDFQSCTTPRYQVDPNSVAARKLGIANDQYRVDQNLIAAQKLGLTNIVPIPQQYHQLPGTNQYSTYSPTTGGGYTQSNYDYHWPVPALPASPAPPPNNIIRGTMRTRVRVGQRGSILDSYYPNVSTKSTIKPDLSFNFKLFDKFEDGVMFLCNKATEEYCLKNMIFAASTSMMENMANITDNTALFLYRLTPKSSVLHGVFQAEGVAGLNLVPRAFGGRFPAQIRVKPLFRFPYPVPNERLKKVFNDNNRCRKLSKLETRLIFREFSILYLRDTLLSYLTRQMGLNEFVPICSYAFDFTKKEMEEIWKSCFEE